ncbi:MAG: response regulator transcription factor [Acidobacteria bacterium]|nr:response regulator transcription factor [Acidobacteriota bacterium]
MADPIRIVIADDHPLVRKGLREVIEQEPDLTVVAEAGDGAEALASIDELRPTIAILDLTMPKMHGFQVAEEARKRRLPDLAIIFLTMHGDPELLERAMELGKGYILKESALTEVVHGIRSVAAGRAFVSASFAGALFERKSKTKEFEKAVPGLTQLTRVEKQILKLVSSGKPSKMIAAELHVHPRTVETHRANISQKLQLTGANSLLRFALENKDKLAD